jgi:molybdate transport system substrate-binding protein
VQRRRLVALVLVLAGSVAACGDDDDSTAATTGPPTSGAVEDVELTVFAAASLTDAFGELGAAFEAATPGATVAFNFSGSSALREQLLGGAPADVFASANTSNMDQVVEGGLVDGEPAAFVTNELQIAVPAGNEAGVAGLADFADADLLLGLCDEDVPCGQFGHEALANAGVTPSIDTEEPDVRSLLTKIEAGELDAGIVYRTDVLSAGDAVEGIDIPPEDNVTATYPIAALADAGDLDAARAFVAFVLSEEGQAILESYGFGTA